MRKTPNAQEHEAQPFQIGEDEDNNPIWLIMGADEDDTTDEDDATEDEDEEEDEEDTDEDDEAAKHPKSAKKSTTPPVKKAAPKKAAPTTATKTWTPPSKAEWDRTQAALQRLSSKEKAARTAQLEKARKEGQTEAATEAREAALKEADSKYAPLLLKKEARLQLADAKAKNPTRTTNLIDFSKCELQEDGEVLGLEGEINRLREEWPELFITDEETTTTKKPAKKAAPAAKVGAADKKDDDKDKDKSNSGAAKVAARLMGAGRAS